MEFVIGAIAGFFVALSFAPQLGDEFRREMGKMPEAAREKSEEIRAMVDEAIISGSSAVKKAPDGGTTDESEAD